MTDSNALNAKQAAQMLGVHVNTIKRIPASILPFYRVTARGDRRYLLADLKLYVEQRTERA